MPDEPPSDGRRLRWASHRSERRAAFVTAGVQAVDEYGPSASAEQIATTARISRTVLYRYFRDRDDLNQAIATEIGDRVIASVLPHLRIDAASTPRDLITSTVGTIIGWFDEHPNLYLFLRERSNGYSLDTVETTLADRVARLVQQLMHLLMQDGDGAEPGAYGIVGFVEASCEWWLAKKSLPGTMPRERFTAAVCEAIWRLMVGFGPNYGVDIGYDEPLRAAPLSGEHSRV